MDISAKWHIEIKLLTNDIEGVKLWEARAATELHGGRLFRREEYTIDGDMLEEIGGRLWVEYEAFGTHFQLITIARRLPSPIKRHVTISEITLMDYPKRLDTLEYFGTELPPPREQVTGWFH